MRAETVPPQEIMFVWVDHRDGEQQEKRYENMPIADRVEVFDLLVDAGMRRAEIGMLVNPHDIAFAEALVEHIADQEAAGDSRYEEVELQVLFGTHHDDIQDGLRALDGFPKDRVVVHAYDRVSFHLRALGDDPTAEPPKKGKTVEQAADDVVQTCQLAYEAGFSRFSISGEGAVNHQDDIDEIIGYYRHITGGLLAMGATGININLANTFGLSPEGQWDRAGLAYFNQGVKDFDTAIPITTTVHAHNDANSATEFGLIALEEGFDGVEGALYGMGERAGNGAIVDMVVRLLEKARVAIESAERPPSARTLGTLTTAMAFWQERTLPPHIAANLHNWHGVAERTAEIYDTAGRLEKTSLGNPSAYDAGCGPHGEANEKFDIDPVGKPLWMNYGMFAIVHAMMGRPEALEVIGVDRDRIRAITLQTHAAGGSTARVKEDRLRAEPASATERQASEAMAQELMQQMLATVCSQFGQEEPATKAPFVPARNLALVA
jgi:isopropylmalate/homocitrate/citramalate synthase